MIIELLGNMIFAVIEMVVSLIPDFIVNVLPWGGLGQIIGYSVYIFGSANLAIVIANISFWSIVHLSWASIEWVYKKLPGVS